MSQGVRPVMSVSYLNIRFFDYFPDSPAYNAGCDRFIWCSGRYKDLLGSGFWASILKIVYYSVTNVSQ